MLFRSYSSYLGGQSSDSGVTGQGALSTVTNQAATTAADSGATTNTGSKITYHTGQEFEGGQVLNLAKQLASATSAGDLKGGVFGTTGQSIGFDFDQAKTLLGDNTTAVNQVFLDAAAGLISRGITDLNQLKSGDVMANATVRPEYDQYGVPTGRYVATWGGDYEGNNQQSRVLTADEAAKVVSKEVGGADGSYTTYEPLNVAIGKGIFDQNGRMISDTSQLRIGDTYTGAGGTIYNLTLDPSTGKPAFSTTGVSTSNVGDLGAILSVLQFVPGAAPFAMAANAALAASQGNTIGALASLTGIPGVSDALNPTLVGALQTANQVNNLANAVQTGNWLGALSSASSLSGAGLGNTQLGDTGFTVNDAMRIGNIVNAVNKGDVGALTRAISTYAKSQNQTGGITNRILDETILDAGVKAFVDSKRAGASDEDAMDASKVATGGVEVPGLADLQNILKTAYAGSGTQLAAADTGTVTEIGRAHV